MELENEMFLVSEPSLEGVLYWKGRESRAEDICKMIKMYRNEIDRDIDSFYEVQYDFCKRAISLLEIYKNDNSYEDVFYIYETLHLDGDEILTGTCESYLENFSSPKNQEFLYQQWKRLRLEWGEEDSITVITLGFLIKSGFRDKVVNQTIKEIIWSDNFFAKAIITHSIECITFADDIKKKA